MRVTLVRRLTCRRQSIGRGITMAKSRSVTIPSAAFVYDSALIVVGSQHVALIVGSHNILMSVHWKMRVYKSSANAQHREQERCYTYKEARDGVEESESHNSPNHVFVNLLCGDAHQSRPNCKLGEANRKEIHWLVDEIDEQAVLIYIRWHVAPMSASSILGLHDRQCKADNRTSHGQCDHGILISASVVDTTW